MSWTDDRVELLRKLWGEGRTAAEIANELGGVTRNAVIGKAHRLKLSGRSSPIQKSTKKRAANSNATKLKAVEKKAPVAAVKAVKVEPEAAAPVAVEKAGMSIAAMDEISEKDKNKKRIPLADLGAGQCRWPLGDPRDKAFGFCGCKAQAGSVYCAEHAAIAYQIVSRGRTLNAEDLEREEKARAEKIAMNGDNY